MESIHAKESILFFKKELIIFKRIMTHHSQYLGIDTALELTHIVRRCHLSESDYLLAKLELKAPGCQIEFHPGGKNCCVHRERERGGDATARARAALVYPMIT